MSNGERMDYELASSLELCRQALVRATYPIGLAVTKATGEYAFDGWIVAVVRKRGGAIRYVVEDERGLLLILNETQIEPKGGA